jgi:hypothetical protein
MIRSHHQQHQLQRIETGLLRADPQLAASENAVTSVASRSTVTSPPPVPGVASPASCQARSQAASHATRIVLSALRRILGQDGDQPGHHRV